MDHNGTSGDSTPRIASLDGLRALSIALVIIGHLWGGTGHAVILSMFGVQVFFVLSGYLITRLLEKEHQQYGRISLRGFYSRRCFRIFPAAYTYIVIVALLFPVARSGLLYAATYTVSYRYLTVPILYQHLWSLSVEEQFYLIWPLLLVFGFRYRAYFAWMAVLAAALFRLVLAQHASPLMPFYMHYSFPGTMDSIAAGCLLAVYEQRLRRHVLWMAAAPAIVVAIPLTAWTVSASCAGDTPFAVVRSMTVLSGMSPLLLALWILLLIERKDRIFNNRIATAVGVLSYSLYLWQQPFATSGHLTPLVAVPVILACATASYFLVERPMLRLGARIRSRGRRARPLQHPGVDAIGPDTAMSAAQSIRIGAHPARVQRQIGTFVPQQAQDTVRD